MKLIYSTNAMREMDEIADYIQQSSPRAALRFLVAVERTAERLLTFPGFGAKYESDDPRMSEIRVCLVSEFERYLPFYRLRSGDVFVERVVLGSRDLPNLLKEDT